MSRWISVKDRLPDGVALVATGRKNNQVVLSAFMRGNHWVACGSFSVLEKVTHWMPLPEVPK